MRLGARICAFFAACVVLFSAMAGTISATASGSDGKSADLGVITVCRYDPSGGTVRVEGTINHRVLTESKNCRIALFCVPAWRTAEGFINDIEPMREAAMSKRFEFSVTADEVGDILSLYAVAIIYPDGSRALVASPRYPMTDSGDTAAAIGFKGVSTDSAAETLECGAGTALIDVYLDRLEDGRHSGYLQSVGGMSFYYNREYIKELDMRVRSASVAGASVLLRLLVSPAEGERSPLPYAAANSYGAAYRGIVISDEVSAVTIYAYISFLCSRYDGGEEGRIDGLVLGYRADSPEAYNFCASTGPMYYEIYARTLAIIGIAAGRGMRLFVSVGDSKNAAGVHAYDFAAGVADYIASHTDLEFTLMVDSRSNAYHLDDSYFDLPTLGGDDEILGGGEGMIGEKSALPPADRTAMADVDDTTATGIGDIYATAIADRPQLYKTTAADDYLAADDITPLTDALERLCGEYSSIRDSFVFCWTPSDNTNGSALSVLFAYNYMSMTAAGAEAFILRTDSARFATVSHLVKYIDGEESDSETAYALEVLGASSWGELLPSFDGIPGGGRRMIERSLTSDSYTAQGSYMLWSSGMTSGTHGWSAGPGCETLRYVFEDDIGCLKAQLEDEGQGAYSDICRISSLPEPAAYTPMIGIDLSCSGDGDGGELYEVKLVVYSGQTTLEGRCVIADGERQMLYLDISDISEIDAIRVAARRVSGVGAITLRTYTLGLYSEKYTDGELDTLIEAAKRAGDNASSVIAGEGDQRVLTAVLLIFAMTACGGYAAVLISRHEKRRAAQGGSDFDKTTI